ncbi:MAG: hypothetical protein COU51_02105 [Parcubacteria group bacterium CG10_big_fil_rev_8_21_14_0_10_36_14]|nr:MAG: hypothetical protein COU51_02105 [Parcubacteria group bacterium CG10_big_fil_rev_8_21_14_0_10_36_14]
MRNVNELKMKKISWINVTQPGKAQMDYLAKKFNLNKEDIIDVLPPIQRMKMIERQKYLFLIIHFPVYNRINGDIYTEEIDFFIMKNTLITVHGNKTPIIQKIFASCSAKPSQKMCDHPGLILYEILTELFNYCFPMLRHINMDIEEVEDMLFYNKKYEKKETVEQTLRIKTNIFDFQRSIRSHGYVLEKFVEKSKKYITRQNDRNKFLELIEYAKEINMSLESYKDAINALHQANSTLVDYRVNQVTKVLTIIATITFPLSLIATAFGIGAEGTPLVHTAWGFWKISALLMSGALSMLVLFRWRRWI